MSSSNDQTLLAELAAHPERREGLLYWGLRYYVRGDIVMSDGSVITLDEICDQIGMPRLSVVDDMLPEFNLDVIEDDALEGLDSMPSE
jgi:hypothetical protein